MKQAATLVLALSLTAPLLAQTPAPAPHFTDPANLAGERPSPITGYELPIDQGTLGLQQLLRKLSTRASILNIVAHPDDEDGGMLTLNARGLGARVADLSLTRGEGGQNAMTGDFEDALGLLRTQELLANDRYTGVSQMFGTEVDFGFSKTKSEAFAKWTHERVLYDAVRAIRIFRPLVITATFIGEPTDGHGQHQVSGEIAQEAFLAAGDPTVFPELTREGILPWQPLKIYARVPRGAITPKGLYDYATNQYVPAEFTNYITHLTTTTPPSADIVIHEGARDPLLTVAAANHADLPAGLASQPATTDLSYIQFARIGLGLQKSQIPTGFRTAPTGAFDVAYHLYGSCLDPSSASAKRCHLAPTAPDAPTTAHHAPTAAAAFQALTARSIPAQGGALGTAANRSPRAESPTYPLANEPTFFDGIDTSIQSLAQFHAIPPAALEKLTTDIDSAAQNFNPAHPDAIAPILADALHIVTNLIQRTESSNAPAIEKYNALHELRIKRTQLNDALALSLGLKFDATTTDADQVVGTPVSVSEKISSRSTQPLTISRTWLATPHGDIPKPASTRNTANVSPDHPYFESITATPPYTSDITRPYFFRDDIETPVYQLRQASLRNAPATPSPLTAWANIDYHGVTVRLGHVVNDGPNVEQGHLVHEDRQPVSFVPPISVGFNFPSEIIPLPATAQTVYVSVRLPGSACVNPILYQDRFLMCGKMKDSAVTLDLPAGWRIGNSYPAVVDSLNEGESPNAVATLSVTNVGRHAQFSLMLPPLRSGQSFRLPAAATWDGQTYSEGFHSIGYAGLVHTNIFIRATAHLVAVDLKIPAHLRIGYVYGTGDDIRGALASIGLKTTTLFVGALTPKLLAQFDTVILGVRAYAAQPKLHGAPTQALLDFARNGGNVLVQYQTDEFTAADAPYPLSLGENAKVVDETAPVELLSICDQPGSRPEHPCEQNSVNNKGSLPGSTTDYSLLTTPNHITPHDFDNWFEERGHGFLSTWDSHYTALLETHDPGAPSEHVAPQEPQRGGLITTQLGKGRWTYCAFALYRQLPEANPGAFRLFINLITP